MERTIIDNLFSGIQFLLHVLLLLLLLALPFIIGLILLGKKHYKSGLIALGVYPVLFGGFVVYGHLERRSTVGHIVRWCEGEDGAHQDANDLADDTKKVVNPSELQQWAMTVLKETEATNYDLVEFPRDKVLPSIQTLQSRGFQFEMVTVDDTNSAPQSRTVWIWWGGGFGHWGIRVGSPAFKVCPDDSNYYVEWKPGIYFWAETH